MSTTTIVNARNAALTAVAVVAVAAMAWLGRWQYGAYEQHQNDDATALLARAPIPLDEVLGPDSAFPPAAVSRPVTVVGRYLADEQFYVRGMGADGRFAVATPVLTASGAAIIVVRGSAPAVPAEAPTGPVRVEGVLEPSQGTSAPLDANRTTDAIQIARLVSAFSHDLYSGYVLATESVPPDPLTPIGPPVPDGSFWAGIRNLLYALQWWAFAGFAVFMWWRMIHDPIGVGDLGDERASEAVAATKAPGDRPT
jgi:cytochrome oxidase assembly protein ShyY1